ncbi:putative response regulator [Leuconostoc phage phiLN6B]|uniref:Uncharacterized protein n=2 Tax=Limdunavirus Lmd1 TaxID=2169978 RepID=I6P9B5_9CAUD|nr:hypothetical protein B616_gp36 [Leuconostoc phage Lmd1]YP_009044331.1 putative response regulator [Leuconostoc phage phiLN6B]AFE86319.1 hypothetical protein phiLmd1_33 [Leuconostoc phage Lmd1]AFY98324.1 putative response regulator [Leuconostoc phage phiLN6B]
MLYEQNLPLTQPYNEKQAKQKQRFDESFGRLRQKQKSTIDKRLSRILEYINRTNEKDLQVIAYHIDISLSTIRADMKRLHLEIERGKLV